MPKLQHHGFWRQEDIPSGPGITPIRYTSEWIIATYYFSNGRDLDTRTRLTVPSIGVVGDYLGWSRASSVGDGVLIWGGDNTGTGFESVAFDVAKFRNNYPDTTVNIDFRCFWFGAVGTNPVQLNVTLYKGGALTKNGYTWSNNTAAESINISSTSKNINLFTQTGSTIGQGLCKLVYNVYSGTGYLTAN